MTRDELREAMAKKLSALSAENHGFVSSQELADAALAVALPVLQQHYAEVAEDASGSMGPVIAAAIRADEGLT